MRARICFLGLVCVCVGCRDLEGPATGEILANIYRAPGARHLPCDARRARTELLGQRPESGDNTAFNCDFYRYYCDPYLEFVGVAGTQYSWVIAGRISDAAWQPGSGR